MITLAQLESEFTAEVLLEATSNLGVDLQNEYNPDSDELSAIRAEAEKLTSTSTSSTSTSTSNASKPSGSAKKTSPEVGSKTRKSQKAAIEKSQSNQKESQGAMVAGQKKVVQSVLKTEKQSGAQVGNLASRTFAHTFLTVRSEGFERFAQNYDQSSGWMAELTDQEYLTDAESEILEGVEIDGGFVLELDEAAEGDPLALASYEETDLDEIPWAKTECMPA